MSIEVSRVSQMTVVETLSGPFLGTDNTVTTNGLNTSETLNASSTPPVTKYSAFAQALTAGAATIDLTSLPDSAGNAGAVTFNGLKVQGYIFKNPSTHDVTLTAGASNGYDLHGSGWSITIRPGEELQWRGNDGAGDVGSGAKTIDLAGTGTDTLDVELIAG